jgi:hypothetical protein
VIRAAISNEGNVVLPPPDGTRAGREPGATGTVVGAASERALAGSELRRVAAAFESVQARRLHTGEEIRRLVSARATDRSRASGGVEVLLARIRAGRSVGPDAMLAARYREQWREERELLQRMSEQLALHPAWHWLGRVRGIGASLAARLLARLDVERAPSPSSFWSYCGLGTVTATMYHCAECGYELSLAAGREVRAGHHVPGTSTICRGLLAPVGESARRVAQPRPIRGSNPAYDREAKKLCYLVGTSLVRDGDAYRDYYHAQRARLDATRADWIPRRRHLTALRMTEKLFLAHLWLVWRERLGLPITAPHAAARDEAVPPPRPWSMVGT